MADNNHGNFRDEQFWFTATAAGFNALVMSEKLDWTPVSVLGITSTCVTLYSVFLILHRSATSAGKLTNEDYPHHQIQEKNRNYQHKAAETRIHLRKAWEQLRYVNNEFSGSFFFLLIISLSYFGVLLKLFGHCLFNLGLHFFEKCPC